MTIGFWRVCALAACLAGLALAGCAFPPTSAQRLAESAYDLNMAARFGRMDVATEHVKPALRDDFGQRHRGWGREIRIDDTDVGQVSIRTDGDADVVWTVNWHRLNDMTMRETELAQRWTEVRGTWYLLSEQERSGDHGLLRQLDGPVQGEAIRGPAEPRAALDR